MKWLMPVFMLATPCVLAPFPGQAGDAMIVNPDQMKWSPVPAVPGTEWAVLSGDLHKRGPFVFELRGPAGTKIPPHWHSNIERVSMISGTGTVGLGDNIDPEKGTTLAPGGYGMMPGKIHHWFVAQGPFAMMIEGNGPFDIHFVHPEDDPTKKTSR